MSTVSPCNLFSPPHKAHILITSKIDCYSAVQGQVGINNDEHQKLSELLLLCFYSPYTGQPTKNKAACWCTVTLSHSWAKIPMGQHREPYMYMNKRSLGSQNTLQGPVIRSVCLAHAQSIFKVSMYTTKYHASSTRCKSM